MKTALLCLNIIILIYHQPEYEAREMLGMEALCMLCQETQFNPQYCEKHCDDYISYNDNYNKYPMKSERQGKNDAALTKDEINPCEKCEYNKRMMRQGRQPKNKAYEDSKDANYKYTYGRNGYTKSPEERNNDNYKRNPGQGSSESPYNNRANYENKYRKRKRLSCFICQKLQKSRYCDQYCSPFSNGDKKYQETRDFPDNNTVIRKTGGSKENLPKKCDKDKKLNRQYQSQNTSDESPESFSNKEEPSKNTNDKGKDKDNNNNLEDKPANNNNQMEKPANNNENEGNRDNGNPMKQIGNGILDTLNPENLMQGIMDAVHSIRSGIMGNNFGINGGPPDNGLPGDGNSGISVSSSSKGDGQSAAKVITNNGSGASGNTTENEERKTEDEPTKEKDSEEKRFYRAEAPYNYDNSDSELYFLPKDQDYNDDLYGKPVEKKSSRVEPEPSLFCRKCQEKECKMRYCHIECPTCKRRNGFRTRKLTESDETYRPQKTKSNLSPETKVKIRNKLRNAIEALQEKIDDYA